MINNTERKNQGYAKGKGQGGVHSEQLENRKKAVSEDNTLTERTTNHQWCFRKWLIFNDFHLNLNKAQATDESLPPHMGHLELETHLINRANCLKM